MFLAVLVAAPQQTSAQSLVPFHAVVGGNVRGIPLGSPPDLCVASTGNGHATHLGKISESASVVSFQTSPNSAGADCVNEMRTTTLTAANGDQITFEATGFNCPTDTTTVSSSDTSYGDGWHR